MSSYICFLIEITYFTLVADSTEVIKKLSEISKFVMSVFMLPIKIAYYFPYCLSTLLQPFCRITLIKHPPGV